MAGTLDYQELIDRLNIVNVINEYVPLKKQGANYKGVCPFHNDRDPSLTVSENKQIFRCFACNVGGNAIKFVSLMDKISYRDAAYKLAEAIGMEFKHGDSNYEERSKLRQDIKSLNKEAAKFYFEELKKSNEAIDYLKNRGLSSITVSKFGLGFAPDKWNALYDHFNTLGISTDLLIKAGLITETTHNGKVSYIDKFRNRVMFPIFDDQGAVIAFGGRIIIKDDKAPKYINSQETAAYIKGDHLYGLNVAKNTKENKLLVVEGYMDCISLHQNGIDFAVASLGTALTQKQAKLIKNKGFNQVILAYDNDGAGKTATIRGMDILKAEGLDVRVFRLSGAKDADEYLKTHPREDFLKQLEKSFSLVEYKVILAAEEFPPTSNEFVIKFLSSVKAVLSKLPDTDRQIYSIWIEENFGKKYNFSREMLNLSSTDTVFTDTSKNNSVFRRSVDEKSNITEENKALDVIEKTLLVMICHNNKLVNIKDLDEDLFTIEINKELFRRIVDKAKYGELSGEGMLYDGSSNDSDIASVLMQYQIKDTETDEAAVEIINKIKLNKLEKEINLILGKLNNIDPSSTEKASLFKRLQLLQSEKKKYTSKH